MWLFHLHSRVKIDLFLQFSPWRNPCLGHFIGYSFGISRNKASTLFYDTAFPYAERSGPDGHHRRRDPLVFPRMRGPAATAIRLRGSPFFTCGEVPDNTLSQPTKEEVLSPYAGRCLPSGFAGLAFVRRRWGGRFSVVFAAGGGCICLREGGRGRRRRLRRARQAQAG